MTFNKSKPVSAAAIALSNDEKGNMYGGASFKDIIDYKKLGIEKWKVAEGVNDIDIIPFNAGKKNPFVVSGQVQEGEIMYALDIYIHSGIGVSKSNYPCLKQFGKDCPICKEASRLWNMNTPDAQEQAKKMFSKRRMIFNVHDLTTGKYGYYDTGYQGFYSDIAKLQQVKKDDEGNPINPYDWENGRTISFLGTKSEFKGKSYNEASTFDFKARKPLSDEVLSHSVDLSDELYEYSPEDLEKIVAGGTLTEKSNESKPSETKTETAESKPSATSENFDDMKEVKPAETAEPKAAETSACKKCPFGHNWGEADNHPECTKCATDTWEACING